MKLVLTLASALLIGACSAPATAAPQPTPQIVYVTPAPSPTPAPTPQTVYVNVASPACLAAVRDLTELGTVQNDLIAAFLRGGVTDSSPAAVAYVEFGKSMQSVVDEATACLDQGSGTGS